MHTSGFSLRLQLVLQAAIDAAKARRHEYVGTEHQLLGLLAEPDGVAAAVLDRLDVERSDMAAQISTIIGKGEVRTDPADELPLTSRAHKVLELSSAAAHEMNHSYVSTEHLLLGIVRERNGVAAQVLHHAGVTDAVARAEILRVLGTLH